MRRRRQWSKKNIAPKYEIPRSYWVEQGYDDDYIKLVENLITEIEFDVRILTSAEGRRQIFLSGCMVMNPETDDEECISETILHDDALMPYWRKFSDALKVSKESSLFAFDQVQLSTELLDLLEPAVINRNIKNFGLRQNEFDNIQRGISYAVNVMGSIRRMREFEWSYNEVYSGEDFRPLLEAVLHHPSINKISFANSLRGGVDDYHVMQSLLSSQKNFTEIDLEGNRIQTLSASGERLTHLPDFLRTNPPLMILNLSGNCLDDIDLGLIANALKYNNNLISLFVSYQQPGVGEEGISALQKAIFDDSSLNSISDSNHICGIIVDHGWRGNALKLNNCSDRRRSSYRTKAQNRAIKLYSELSSRNKERTNVYHLGVELKDEDLSCINFGLMPSVLSCIYTYYAHRSECRHVPDWNPESCFVVPLSIMYEILSGTLADILG